MREVRPYTQTDLRREEECVAEMRLCAPAAPIGRLYIFLVRLHLIAQGAPSSAEGDLHGRVHLRRHRQRQAHEEK